ncbi:replication-associated protein [Capybara virus 8_cap1_36]|nr:replication-associated protein [Capybara virus 8_cap1_36]
MPFNFNAKNAFLTYPQCSLSKEEILENLSNIAEVAEYTIASELHQDGSSHIHAFISFSKKYHSTSERCFDILGFHPNIKSGRSQKDLANIDKYCKKDGDFITNRVEKLGKRAALASQIIKEGKISKKFIVDNPEVIYLNYSSITQWLRHLAPKTIQVEPPQLKRRHYWVTGPSNCGKTYWLRAFKQFFENAFEIPTNNDYQGVDETTDLLWFDEYRGQLTVQTLNRLCDGDARLNIKGGATKIHFPLVVIVSNFSVRDCYPKIQDFLLDTLYNRFIEYDLSINMPPFYKSKVNL